MARALAINDYLAVSTGTTAYDLPLFSFSLRYRTSRVAPGNPYVLLSRFDASGSNLGYGVYLDAAASYKAGLFAAGASGAVVSLLGRTPSLNDGRWRHVGGVLRQASGGRCRLYVDGIEEDSDVTSASWSFSGQDLRLGDSLDAWWGDFIGDYADLALWSDELDPADFTLLANGAYPPSVRLKDLVDHWPLRGTESPEASTRSSRVFTPSGTSAVAQPYTTYPTYRSPRRLFKKPTTVTAASVRGSTRGARNLSEVLACKGGVLINRNSPQAKGLRLWYPTVNGSESVLPDPVEGRHMRWLQSGTGLAMKADPTVGRTFYTPGSGSSASAYALWAWENRGLPLRGRGLTIAAWLRIGTYAAWEAVISKAENTNNSGVWDWGILLHGSGTKLWLIRNGAGPAAGPVDFTANVLFHLVYTCDDTFSQHVINGVPQTSAGGIGTGDTSNVNIRGIYLGGNGFSPEMYVADLRVYDRRMSVPEMQALYDPRTRFDLYAVPGGTTHVQSKAARRKVRYVDRRGARTLGEIL